MPRASTVRGMIVYIYSLRDPRDNALRYIGKTTNPKRRWHAHCKDFRTGHKDRWLKQLNSIGLKPIMEIVETIENSNDLDWQDRERWWIKSSMEAGHPLTNLDSGGNSGMEKSAETRAKLSTIFTGRKQSQETIEKRRPKLIGHTMSAAGRAAVSAAQLSRRHTEETKSKIRAARAKQVISDETRAKLSAALKGRMFTDKMMARLRAYHAVRVFTPEMRLKMRLAKLGKKNTPEQIEAKRQAQLARWARYRAEKAAQSAA